MDNKKQNGVKLQGVVQKCLSNGMFRVKLENGFHVLAYLSGKIRINFIRILLGDHVIVEMSLYDLSKGRILYRLQRKKNNFKPKKKNNFKPKKKNNFKPKKKK